MATVPLSLGLATFFLQLFSGSPSSTFTIVNQCNYTVWPALASSSGAGDPSISPTGFVLQPGESTSISVPTSWNGRLWGRTFCAEDPSGNFSCLTGGCGSRTLECSGFGALPATLAEFALNSFGGSDFYDVSFVDGYNLPMMISPHGGTGGSCISAGCAADLNGDCPRELKVVNGSEVVACKGACDAFKTPQYCCTGDYVTPQKCKPTSYSQFFKIACPTAYSYPTDDIIGTFTCTGADYAITFCASTSASASASNPEIYKNCRDALFECGNISVGYPFFGGRRRQECGHPALELRCDYHNHTTTIEIGGVKHLVLDIRHESQTLTIVRQDLFNNGFCKPQTPIQGSVIDSELFGLVPPQTGYTNVTLFYGCQSAVPSSLGIFPCNDSGYNNVSVTTDGTASGGCPAELTFPISNPSSGRFHFRNDSNLLLSLGEAMKTGFQVKWNEDSEACRNCNASGGACGFNIYNSKTICLCPFQSSVENECRSFAPPPSQTYSGNNYTRGSNNSSSELHRKLIIGSTVSTTVVVTIFVCIFVMWFKRNSISDRFNRRKRKDKVTIEAFITNFGSFAPKQYSYGEIKKMTNEFSDKLGQGGFGSVYKGKLSDGRFVAVKILNESKGNGEDFMNEVTSISRTSHVNIVTLLGFCFKRSKRALIYEYMAHGSLDKFIYSRGSDDQSRQLEWKTLYNIAIAIARGLEYLHQGCNTRILHFDIKPHNILLDENFCPKISDFGLSKSCKTKESVVSMTGTRGTIGYIAPEVYCRNFGGVSYKSDVYSYGMLILEMVGGRKNINGEASHTSEVYFPTWIYKHLDQSLCLNLDGVVVEDEEEITRKLTIVSLWCIQNDPSDRPSMTKVLEMLQGSVQSLVIPPRPFVSSPVR